MKNKALYKAVAFWFTALLLVFYLSGCKTKQVAVQTEKQNHFVDATEMVEKQETVKVSNTAETKSTEVKELTELLQNLNVNYSGQDLNDKLDLLLSKTEQGTKLTISGKGTANYSDSQKSNVESLRTELYARQDSLHSVEMSYLQDLQSKIDSYTKKKYKDVKTKTFTSAVWLIIGLAVVVGLCLNWLSKLFKR